MGEYEFDMIQEKIESFQYSSMKYCDYEELKNYDFVCNTDNLIVIRGFNLEAKSTEYHWAANKASDVIREIKEGPCFITFVPHEWVFEFEAAGYSVRNAWHDYFMHSLERVNNEIDTAEFLNIEDCEVASNVTMSCRDKSRGFTGQSAQWINAWLTQEDELVNNKTILVHRSELGEIVGIVCTGTYGHESEKGAIVWIREAAVMPHYQNQGIARKLIMQALSYGKKCGAKRAFLAADECNHNAIHLYKSIGFEPSDDESQIDMVKN